MRALEIDDTLAEAHTSLAHVYMQSYEWRSAEAEFFRAMSQSRFVSPYDMAIIHVGLDEKDKAFERLRLAYEEHAEWGIYLNIDPRLDPLRSDARFTELVRRTGLHAAGI